MVAALNEDSAALAKQPANADTPSGKVVAIRARTVTVKAMQRVPGAPEPIKYNGTGLCDSFSRSTTLAAPTADATEIAHHAIRLYDSLEIIPSQLRGIGIEVSKLVHPLEPDMTDQGGALVRMLQTDDSTCAPTIIAQKRSRQVYDQQLVSSTTPVPASVKRAERWVASEAEVQFNLHDVFVEERFADVAAGLARWIRQCGPHPTPAHARLLVNYCKQLVFSERLEALSSLIACMQRYCEAISAEQDVALPTLDDRASWLDVLSVIIAQAQEASLEHFGDVVI
jgi:hypothetical protein